MTAQEITSGDIAHNLAVYLAEIILGDGNLIDLDQNLLMEGIVDSLGLLRMVGHIEKTYDVKIPPEDYILDNFRSLNTVGHYVVRLFAKRLS
jgi:acyl carrier protein